MTWEDIRPGGDPGKPGKLSELEMNIIGNIQPMGGISSGRRNDLGLAMIVYQHHERIDGSGLVLRAMR